MDTTVRKRRLSLNRIGLRHSLITIGMVAITMLISFALVFFFVRDQAQKYVMGDLLEAAKAVAGAESAKEKQEWNQELIRFYESMTGATVMYMDSAIMYIQAENPADEQIPREIIQFDVMDSAEEEEHLKRIYILDTLERYDLMQILEGHYLSDIRSFTFSEDDIIIAGAPIWTSDSEIAGAVVLVQETKAVDSQIDMMLRAMLIAAIASMALTVLVSAINGYRLSSPIRQITDGARKLTEGRYGELIHNRNTGTELDTLAGTLNTLSWQLSDVFSSLHQEQDKLNLIMDTLNEGIIAVDWYMNVLHCNHPFLEMLELRSVPDKLDTVMVEERALYDSMRTKNRVSMKWTTENGRRLAIMASPIYGKGRLVMGSVGVVVDVSESERMEQLRKDYVANISHELRTPLTGIRGMVEPLMDGIFETEEERQDCYSVIYQETLRLEKLIEDMLDMSRLQDGRITIETETLVIDEILAFAMRRVTKTAADSGIELRLELENDNMECVGNEDRILQVITIFLDNAISFTPSGGSITITARNRSDDVYIGVKDTGCGIEPKDIPYIWERFYKSDKSRMRTRGTGLGLAIAKLIVELMGGKIGVESHPGNGAEFWFTLKK